MRFSLVATGARRHGYTLIEMAIAASIMGLVSITTGPSVFRAMEDLRYRTAVEDLAGVLQTVRAEAISARHSTQIALNAGNGQLHSAWDQNGNGVIDAPEWRPIAIRVPTEYIGSPSPPVGRFSSRGIFHVSTGHWTIRLNGPRGKVRYVYVFPSGHITITETPLP